MKYKELTSFDNHVQKSLPEHVSHGFLFLVPQEEEREYFLSLLVKKLTHFFPQVEVWHYDREEHSVGAALEKLFSPSLFHEGTVYVFDGLDDIDATLWEGVKKGLRQSAPSSFFLLGSTGKKASIYSDLKKEVIALDLSEEKPWHRKERLTNQLVTYAKSAGKVVETILIEKILAVCQMNLSISLKALDRCFLFAKDKERLTLQEVEALLPPDPEEKMWDLAERMVWTRELVQVGEEIDLLPFLGALRYQLQLGLKLLGFPNPSPETFPKVHKGKLPQYVKIARELGFAYFQRGIVELFHREIEAKTFLDPKKALDLVLFHLQKEKPHAPSFAQSPR